MNICVSHTNKMIRIIEGIWCETETALSFAAAAAIGNSICMIL